MHRAKGLLKCILTVLFWDEIHSKQESTRIVLRNIRNYYNGDSYVHYVHLRLILPIVMATETQLLVILFFLCILDPF